MARMRCNRCNDTGVRHRYRPDAWLDADLHDKYVHAGTRTASVLG